MSKERSAVQPELTTIIQHLHCILGSHFHFLRHLSNHNKINNLVTFWTQLCNILDNAKVRLPLFSKYLCRRYYQSWSPLPKLACTMLILLYVKDEISFDKFHKNGNNIYRIVSKSKRGSVDYKNSHTGFLQGPQFAKNVPGIESFVRIQSSAEDIKTGTEIQSQELLRVDPISFPCFLFHC